MATNMKAIEAFGEIDEHQQLRLDEPLPIGKAGRVRVIILLSEESEEEEDEREWLQAARRNPAFDFLADPEEDIYTLTDGKPFRE